MPKGASRERLDPQIRSQLRRERSQQARDDYIRQLRVRFGTELAPPPSERIAIDANPRGGPERGPADAPVTIVIFSDLGATCSRPTLSDGESPSHHQP